ncbi:MAG: SDR family oxidoreductase [Pseudomonadota bacterium]
MSDETTSKYSVKDKVAIVSGSSRGIGKEVALKLAEEGCHVAILAKTDKPHPTLEGTIHMTAEAVQKNGVEALPIVCDIRYEEQIDKAINQIIAKFGRIDYVINNASAIYLTDTQETTAKQFDLMFGVNVRGTYLLSRAAIPFLKQSPNPHIVNFAPPLVIDAVNFYSHLPYTMSKYGMSMCTIGMAHEFFHDNIAVNSLWPRTIVKTAALDRVGAGAISDKYARKPRIMADATYAILKKPSQAATGTFLIDDLVLQADGVKDFDQYACEAGHPLIADLFLPHDLAPPPAGVIVQSFNLNAIDKKH